MRKISKKEIEKISFEVAQVNPEWVAERLQKYNISLEEVCKLALIPYASALFWASGKREMPKSHKIPILFVFRLLEMEENEELLRRLEDIARIILPS